MKNCGEIQNGNKFIVEEIANLIECLDTTLQDSHLDIEYL